MKIIKPNNDAPIPMRSSPPRIGTIVLRFVGLFVLTVTLLALAWSRCQARRPSFPGRKSAGQASQQSAA